MMAKPKIEGPYKVAKTEDGRWKIVRVVGHHPSLENVERWHQKEQAYRNRSPRPDRPARPPRDTSREPHDEAFWKRQREIADQEITRDIDGTKSYIYRQAAHRRCLQLNKQYQAELDSYMPEPKPELESDYLDEEEIEACEVSRPEPYKTAKEQSGD